MNHFGWLKMQNFGDDEMQRQIVSFFSDYKSDFVVIGGGNILNEKFLKPHLNENKKYIFFNVGLDNPEDFPKEIPPQSFWIVRDNYTYQYLISNGFRNVYYASDIVLNTTRPLGNKYKIIGVCLNHFLFKNLFSKDAGEKLETEYKLNEIAKYLEWMRHFGWQVKFLPLQINSQNDDRIYNSYVFGLNEFFGRNIMTNENLKPQLAECSFIISGRYHSTMLAIANKTPFIHLGQSRKSEETLKDFDLRENILRQISKENLVQKTIDIEKNKEYNNKCDKILSKGQEDWNIVSKKLSEWLV